jgi:hypothetical protein
MLILCLHFCALIYEVSNVEEKEFIFVFIFKIDNNGDFSSRSFAQHRQAYHPGGVNNNLREHFDHGVFTHLHTVRRINMMISYLLGQNRLISTVNW